MKPSQDIKPISYVKSHAAELLQDLSTRPRTLVITQNGEAKAVLQDIQSYERTQDSLNLLKLLALGHSELAAGQVKPLAEGFTDLRKQLAKRRETGQ